MAMPLMEVVPAKASTAWIEKLVDSIAAHSGALDRTVFELQARDWPIGREKMGKPVDPTMLAEWMRRLERRGARSFGFYPADFLQSQHDKDRIRLAISTSRFTIVKTEWRERDDR